MSRQAWHDVAAIIYAWTSGCELEHATKAEGLYRWQDELHTFELHAAIGDDGFSGSAASADLVTAASDAVTAFMKNRGRGLQA